MQNPLDWKRSKARIGPRRKFHKQTKGVEGLPSSELPSPDWRTAVDIPSKWINISTDTPDMRLCSVSFQEMTGCPPLVVTRSLIIKQDHCWSMHVHGHLVDPSVIQSLALIPSTLDSESATLLLQRIDQLHICAGNPEAKFVALGEKKKNRQFLSSTKEVVAYLETGICVTVKEQQYPSTIRCVSCHLLTDGTRCSVCSMYRKHLIVQHSRAQKCSTSVQKKKINYR